jgi:hypothetical protein
MLSSEQVWDDQLRETWEGHESFISVVLEWGGRMSLHQ